MVNRSYSLKLSQLEGEEERSAWPWELSLGTNVNDFCVAEGPGSEYRTFSRGSREGNLDDVVQESLLFLNTTLLHR